MKKLFFLLCTFIYMINTQSQQLKTVTYTDGQQSLKGMVTSNAGSNKPGVLILPAWKGIDDEAKNAALALEKKGYIAFIADIYGEGNVPKDNEQASKAVVPYYSDYKKYQHRIELALNQLKKSGVKEDKIAVIGYCFGGSGRLEVARAGWDVKGIVSIHGGLKKYDGRPNNPIKTKVLIENGAEDPGATPEVMTNLTKELNDGKADWQVITYAHCKHTFTDPKSPDYNKIMADRAWNHTLLFLDEVLK